MVCFTALLGVLIAILWLIGVFVKKRVAKPPETDSSLSRMGGTVLGLLEGAFVISIIIMIINFYPVDSDAKSPAESPFEHTLSYKVVGQMAPSIESLIARPVSHLKNATNGAETDKTKSDNL